ncbi:hypothetical protein AWM68_07120 [Fictibacillus phosphorivorans]|uniref:Uncharacterized protein n=1 Tax=Fictibacillus phosphorivorans TaxID=1221500 RepID=A0A163R3M5_9BACL|nr:hypothetical protein [Fictibacillus phosphorivorans]KZE66139.1 hypothetical protein AWM68_07120 [Fictibacillus phosphorivorans]
MAKSRARKCREKMLRKGMRNPLANRSAFATEEMYKMMSTKKTKTKKEILNQTKHKKRLSSTEYSEDNRFFDYTACF